MPAMLLNQLTGVILGTAVGDAIGLPREGLSRRRARRMFGSPPLQHCFLFGRGMVSDDTEHTWMVGQSLLEAPEDARRFARSFGWKLRLWLLGLPAGMGLATARAVVKLWLGFPPHASGVWSAGNGPAMRAALLGVCLGHDRERLRSFVRASTRLTHTDPKAERGALIVALAAHHGVMHGTQASQGDTFFQEVRTLLPDADEELQSWLKQLEVHLQRGASAAELAEALGLASGVSGYMYHTVPLALYCWLRYAGDFRQAVEAVIDLGGDADSTGALVGGLAGATLGEQAIPREWLEGLIEWPRSVGWMRQLAERLATVFPRCDGSVSPQRAPYAWPGQIPRNLFFLAIVLAHGCRRILPPY
jgi:ADP-ribosylglycohydrolase